MKTPFRAVGAVMLGLSLCGGLLTSAGAAPATTAGATTVQAPAKAGKGKGRRGDKAGRGGLKMMAQLNLTDAQKAQLMPLMKAQRQEMKALRDDTTLAPDAKRAKAKALRADYETKIKAILTPAQQQQLAAFKAQRRAEMKANGGEKGGRRARGGPQAPVPAT